MSGEQQMPQCPVCAKTVKVTGEGRWYKHNNILDGGKKCDASGTMVPNQQTGAPSTNNSSGSAAATSYPVSTSTPRNYSGSSMTPDEFMDGDGRPSAPEPTAEELELAARIKETFYAYTNRMERNQQTTLGPSEAGTPCDRRLALHMLGMPPVNPGGDNWAAFKGTCIHAGLEGMFTWADAGTGRYAVEVPLVLPSAVVPHGTADLIDRMLHLLGDQKTMGAWSLDKFTRGGPSPTQYVQVHLYAYAARRRGERVDKVAIVAWPVASTSLDDLKCWVRDYDPTVAVAALLRVEHIAAAVRVAEDDQGHDDSDGDPRRASQLLRIASEFKVADDCRYCPYNAPDDSQREWGCNGKQ